MSTFDGGADSTRSMLQPNLAETCETTETTLIFARKVTQSEMIRAKAPVPQLFSKMCNDSVVPDKGKLLLQVLRD